MDLNGNISYTFYTPYSNIYIYCTSNGLLFCGLIMNILFIVITFKEKKTKKQTDVTLVMPCFVQCGYTLFMYVKTTYLFTWNEKYDIAKPWMVLFESLDLLFSGLYIWVSISLNLGRFVVIKNIEQVPTTNTRIQRSSRCKWLSYFVIVALSVTYGIVSLYFPKIAFPVGRCILQLSVSGFPWLFFLILNVLIVLFAINIAYNRHKNKAACFHDTPETTGIDPGRQPNITDKLLQQVAYSMIFQISLLTIPYTFIVTMHLLSTNYLLKPVMLQEKDQLYCIFQSMVPLLNPVALGLLLKQRRDMLTSFLDVRKISSLFITSQKISPISAESLQTIHETEEFKIQDISTKISVNHPSMVPPRSCFVEQYSETPLTYSLNNGDRICKLCSTLCDVNHGEFIIETDREIDTLPRSSEDITNNINDISQLSQAHHHKYSSDLTKQHLSTTSLASVASSRSKTLKKDSTVSSNAERNIRVCRGISINSEKTVCNRSSLRSFMSKPSLQYSVSIISSRTSDSTIQDTILYF